MSLAFSNLNKKTKPNNMEPLTSITQQQYDNLKRYHKAISYNQDELADMVNINRLFVNPLTPSCLSCQGSMRKTKGELMSWFLENEAAILKNLEPKVEAKTKKK